MESFFLFLSFLGFYLELGFSFKLLVSFSFGLLIKVSRVLGFGLFCFSAVFLLELVWFLIYSSSGDESDFLLETTLDYS